MRRRISPRRVSNRPRDRCHPSLSSQLAPPCRARTYPLGSRRRWRTLRCRGGRMADSAMYLRARRHVGHEDARYRRCRHVSFEEARHDPTSPRLTSRCVFSGWRRSSSYIASRTMRRTSAIGGGVNFLTRDIAGRARLLSALPGLLLSAASVVQLPTGSYPGCIYDSTGPASSGEASCPRPDRSS